MIALPVLIAYALLAGAALPLQASINYQLKLLVGSPFLAVAISFMVGLLALTTSVILIRVPMPRHVFPAPWWIWTGGLLGAFFLVATVLVTPRLGAATSFSLFVAGQMAASLVLDRFGLFGLSVHTISAGRVGGAALLVAGVVMLRVF